MQELSFSQPGRRTVVHIDGAILLRGVNTMDSLALAQGEFVIPQR